MRVERVQVDENGFIIKSVLMEDTNEDGTPVEFPPDLVPPNTRGGLWLPKWNFNTLEWEEGNIDLALEMTKENKKYQFKQECNTLIESGFTSGEYRFFFDKEAQLDFAMKLTYLNSGLGDPDIIRWKTMDNGVKIFNREQFFSICQAGHDHYEGNKGALWKLEAYIDGLTSLDELNSLTDFESAKELVKN